jgi:excisionase family DNA binding protein
MVDKSLETSRFSYMTELLSSAEAAELLEVSAATIKRWADEGMLPCVRTAGNHRRFTRPAVERLRSQLAGQPVESAPGKSEIGRLIDLLIHDTPEAELEAALLSARGRLGSWWQVAEHLGVVLEHIGTRWEQGRLTVIEEHLASHRLQRAIGRMVEWQPVFPQAPIALLATAEGDDHTLGLSLVELCLREQGWRARWVGRFTPVAELVRAVSDVDLVAVSASQSSNDARALGEQGRALVQACRRRQARVLLGGRGAWPEVKGAQVVRELRRLPDVLLRP